MFRSAADAQVLAGARQFDGEVAGFLDHARHMSYTQYIFLCTMLCSDPAIRCVGNPQP
jgi:hypothetical protein